MTLAEVQETPLDELTAADLSDIADRVLGKPAVAKKCRGFFSSCI